MTRFSISEMLTRSSADVHPPAYYLLLSVWTTVFNDSVFSMRLLSVVCSGVSIFLLYRCIVEATHLDSHLKSHADESQSISAGLLAAGMLALSSFEFRFSHEARMYSFGTMTALGGSLLLIRALTRGDRHYWVLYTVVRLIGLYTHNWLLLTFVADAFFVLVSYFRGSNVFINRRNVRRFLLSGVAISFCYLPWLPILLRQLGRIQEDYWTPRASPVLQVLSTPYRLFAMQPTRSTTEAVCVVTFLLLLAVFLLGSSRLSRLYFGIAGFAPLLIGYIVSQVSQRHVVVDSCLAFSFPFLIAGFASLIAGITDSWIRRCMITASLAISAFFLAVFLWRIYSTAAPGMREAIQQLSQKATVNDHIVTSSIHSFLPAKYYLRHSFSPWFLLEEPLRWDRKTGLAESEIHRLSELSSRRSNARIWVVDLIGLTPPTVVPSQWELTDFQRYRELLPTQDNGDFVPTSITVGLFVSNPGSSPDSRHSFTQGVSSALP